MVASIILASAVLGAGQHKIVTKTVDYKDGDTVLEGYAAYPEGVKSAPGIVVVHQWSGLSRHEMDRAERLAGLGYVAFAVDIYGKGVRPTDRAEFGRLAGKYKGDRALFQERLLAGYKELRSLPGVNKSKIGAIGFCFGGTGVLELARTGVALRGGVTFHGGLDNPDPDASKKIRCPLLILTGADDPSVPPSQVKSFEDEMAASNVKYRVVSYPGAVHAFTQKEAGNDNSKGAAYNAEADVKSWAEMKAFFTKAFR